MLKSTFEWLLMGTVLIGCTGKDAADTSVDDTDTDTDTDDTDTGSAPEVDEVYSASTFTVDLQSDEVYGQGQTHSSWNAPNPDVMDLKLDLYVPENEDTQRPLVVFTHGGGWSGGDKANENEVAFCNYFAERGFVCASLNYRLRGDRGTVPQAYVDAVSAAENVTPEDISQVLSMYPAGRDCKTAVRWLVANASVIGFNVGAISLIGGSAGAHNSIVMDVSEPEDYRDELTEAEDPTLASTNMDVEFDIQSVVNHWGGAGMMQILEDVYGHDRFDSTDAPLLIVHGTADETADFSNAEELVDIYTNNGVYNELIPLEDKGHGAWNATVDGQNLAEISFEFITEQLDLAVVE